ncbi:UNVERIFIED_CONTAM: hypothetical protein Sangu_0490900 [Sesamum angustifolium]|uniref:RNase H type-1 domain-containing protein n=1 Tax=Sesamum angustifolium TaxID=2727405 RepID=A0AAW2Q841_9LAMI
MDVSHKKSIKEVQKLVGRLSTLNRFISRFVDKGLPFFKVLHSVAKFEWNKTNQEPFDELQRTPSVRVDEPFLEISVIESGALRVDSQMGDRVNIYVDGSSTSVGSGAGIVLESPQGDKFEYAIKLEYPSSNNEAEYEAFLVGEELALVAEAKRIISYSGSQLVVNQIQGSYEAQREKMAKYSLKTKNLLGKFEETSTNQVSISDNVPTDQLAKLASLMAAI